MATGYRFGAFTLDLATMTLNRDNATVDLRPKAFDTLRALVERGGQVVTKDELVSTVWPDVIVNDDALSQCIRDVRRALGDDGAALIRTVPRRGYIFDAPVESLQGRPPGSARPNRRRLLFTALALVLVSALAAAWFLRPDPAAGRQITVAVLPFAAVGPDEGQAWLGEGIAEDIMTELSRFTDLGVIARNSSFRYATLTDSPQAVGQSLGADYLMQGSVRRAGEEIRVAIQLVETGGGKNVWAEQFDTPVSDLSGLPNQLAGAIAARLAVNVFSDASSAAALRARSADAFEATLRARHAYYRFTRDTAYDALRFAEQAVRLDPGYAAAHEMKARSLVQFFVQPYDDRRGDPAILDAALEAAREAVHLDPASSSAVSMLGDVYTWKGEHEAGLQHLRRAVELNPNDASAQKRLADALGRAGQHEASLAAWQAAIRLDPVRVPLTSALMGRSHLLLGEYERALDLTGDCIEVTPKMMPCHIFHAMAAAAAGDAAAAEASVRRIATLAPGFTVNGWLGIVGYRDDATIARLRELAVAAGLPP